jgi:hypothetical protein
VKRRLTLVVCALGLAGWAIIACYLLFSGSDPATAGLDMAALAAVTALFALTTFPAILLGRGGRFPNAALALALAFPLAFLLLFALIVASLA